MSVAGVGSASLVCCNRLGTDVFYEGVMVKLAARGHTSRKRAKLGRSSLLKRSCGVAKRSAAAVKIDAQASKHTSNYTSDGNRPPVRARRANNTEGRERQPKNATASPKNEAATMRTVAWLICIHNACAADYWMAWPDHYARGGGLGNQLEQILGRVQCAATNARTMVLPDLRADRSSMRGDARHHAFERVFDVPRLRTVANVATWRAMLHDCEGVSFVVEGDEHKCDAFSPPAAYAFTLLKKHARAYEAPSLVRTCVVAPGAVALNKLPRCAVGVDVREFLLLGPCSQAASDKRSAFKSARPCRGLDVASSPCRGGFRWDSALNASRHFLGLVAPRREETHLGPCAAHALGRLDASEPRARALLTALRAAPPLRTVVSHAMQHLGGTYDAVHVRLGDFGSLCAKRPKFCPPSDAELSRIFAVLDALNNPAPVLLLSDDPKRALDALGNSRVRPVSEILNASLGETSAPARVAAEMDLAAGARVFVGVACSTVSQLIVKRREALGRPFMLWP